MDVRTQREGFVDLEFWKNIGTNRSGMRLGLITLLSLGTRRSIVEELGFEVNTRGSEWAAVGTACKTEARILFTSPLARLGYSEEKGEWLWENWLKKRRRSYFYQTGGSPKVFEPFLSTQRQCKFYCLIFFFSAVNSEYSQRAMSCYCCNKR